MGGSLFEHKTSSLFRFSRGGGFGPDARGANADFFSVDALGLKIRVERAFRGDIRVTSRISRFPGFGASVTGFPWHRWGIS